MRLVAALCALIGVLQFVFSRSLYGIVWIVAAVVLFEIDRRSEV